MTPGSGPQARFDVVPGTGQQPATVRAVGDIDLASARQFQAALAKAAASSEAAAGEITADLTAVTYCDSAAIHALFTFAKQHRLTVVVPGAGPITTMLKISGLDQIATVITTGALNPPLWRKKWYGHTSRRSCLASATTRRHGCSPTRPTWRPPGASGCWSARP